MAVSQSLTLTKSILSIASNTSKVRILWQSTQTGESWNGYTRTAKYYVSINGGAETEYSVSYTLPQNATATIVDTTIIVNHKTNGSGSVRVRTWMDTGISVGVVTQDKTITLDTIPRATTLDSITSSSGLLTGAITYNYTPKSNTFYNKCVVDLLVSGVVTNLREGIELGKAEASQQTATITLSSDDLFKTIYPKLPTATKGILMFTLYTYTDSGYSTKVGTAVSKTITLTIPNDTTTQPTMDVRLTPADMFTLSNGLYVYVKGLSKVKAAFVNAKSPSGADTSFTYKLTVAGKDYGSPYISDYLTTAGDSVPIKATITDSRGYSRTYTEYRQVLDYTQPSINSITCSTDYFNGSITYKFTPANPNLHTRCDITFGSTTIKTFPWAVDQETTQTFTFGADELDKIYRLIPNGTTGKLKFTLRTGFLGKDEDEITSAAVSREITLTIPNIDATQPTAELKVEAENSLDPPFNTLYIKGKTKAKATLASGAGEYGATPKSYKVTIGTQSGASPLTSDNLLTIGDLKITGTVTDTRGYSRTYEKTITVLDHSTPRIIPVSGQSSVIAARCNADGELDSNGTGLLIAAKRAYSKVVSGNSQKNYCAIQFRYKVDGGSYGPWTELLSRTATSDEVITVALPVDTLSTTSTYMVQVRAIDDLGEAGSTTIFVSTEKVYMHRAGSLNAIAIGKYAEEENTVDIGEDMTTIFRGEVQFKSEAWISRALGTNVVASTVNSGRWGGTGVFYRVCAGGKHIYVAFNVSFTTSSSTVRAESETIPSAYRPPYDVYALCPVGFSDNSRGIATVSVSPSGRVNIYAVHKLPGATLSTGETVKWIDGYVDFWT